MIPREPARDRNAVPDEPPPFPCSWGFVYGAIAAYLAMLILLFYAIGRIFTP